MTTLCALLIFSASSTRVQQQGAPPPRIRLPFNFGWRYRYGEPDATTPACSGGFEDFASGIACQQVNEHDNSATLEDCRASCCADPACGVYLFTSDSTVAPHLPTGNFSAHCWLGHEASTPCRNTPH
eukprot:gene28681-26210_t